jgi:gluconate kinase
MMFLKKTDQQYASSWVGRMQRTNSSSRKRSSSVMVVSNLRRKWNDSLRARAKRLNLRRSQSQSLAS